MKINPQYSVKITEDGSPTLVFSSGADQLYAEEKMHSLFGAATETEYVYGPAIEWAFEHVKVPKFIVVGLGLGYIEFLIARQGRVRNAFYEILSFESDVFLRDSMLSWVHEEKQENALYDVFADALKFIAGPDTAIVKEELRVLLENGKWRLEGALGPDSRVGGANSILYDLFSTRISPELWEEEFLSGFLGRTAETYCSFATYASRGGIKRALKKNGFGLVEKRGFGNKRESTLAFKPETSYSS